MRVDMHCCDLQAIALEQQYSDSEATCSANACRAVHQHAIATV